MTAEEFSRRLYEDCQLAPGSHVLAAVSGGADSIALLCFLLEVRAGYPLSVSCVHVEHGIRGEASMEDLAFVRELCEKKNVAFYAVHVDAPAYAKAQGCGMEDAARTLRYDALQRIARESSADAIVLAHHAGDQAETVLLHAIRGSDLRGLCAMRMRRGMLLRPLLGCTAQELRAYLDSIGQRWREDQSNKDVCYARNRIRHGVMPELERAAPGAGAALCRLANAAQRDEDYFAQTLDVLDVHGIPLIDGIGPDEFIVPAGRKDPKDAALGYNNPGRGFSPEHFAAIKEWNKKYPEKSFYAWVGIPWNGDCTAIASLHEAVISNPRGAILWESYLNGKDADKGIQSRYLDRGAIFKAASGGSLKNYIMAPATYEYMDNNGAVDFKVFLDQQFHTVATNPVFADVRGFSMWVAYYTEPEILRWFSKLVQHYGVDGEKTLLSSKYGYKLYPGILKAHNWENAKDWKLSGGASLMAKKDANIKQGYIPYTSVNFLRMELGAGKKPAATQVLTGLKPGKLYSIKTQFCTPDNPAKSDINVDIKLENAEIIDVEKRFLEDFTRRAPHIWNVRKVIFRAGKKPVKLVITEGEGAAASTVIVDSVQAAPYFTE